MTAPPSARIHLTIATDLGEFVADYSERGLAGLRFPSGRNPVSTSSPDSIPARINAWHRTTSRAVRQTLAGCTPTNMPPLDLAAGTEFQQSVWRAMMKIPLGETRSYGELARIIGRPQAVRAVGGACGANPIPVLVPCHRVLAAHGRLGGFSCGLDWKRALLAREGRQLL